MAFKPQVSSTDNSIKEKRSVLFIENLLVGKAKTDIFTIDSMQSTSLRQAFDGTNYISVMQENLESLKKALN